MNTARPFRLFLKHVPPSNEAEARERLALLRELSRNHMPSQEAQERILALQDEELLWHLLQRSGVVFGSYGRPEEGMLKRIVTRALTDLNQDGVLWTPLIDWLAQAYAISRVNRQRTLPGSPRQPPPFPSETELAERLVPWLESASDPTAIEDLVEFRAAVVLSLTARHARAISRNAFERLRDTNYTVRCELAKNPQLDTAWRAELATSAWEEYRSSVSRKRATWEASQATLVLGALARHGDGLPQVVRNEILKRQRRVTSPDRGHVAFLLEDRGLGSADAKRLLPLLDDEGRARLLVREVCDAATTRKPLADRAAALCVLKDENTETKWVAALVNTHINDRAMMAVAARHPNLSGGAIRRTLLAAEEWPEVQLILVRRGAVRRASAPSLLVATKHAAVAEELLPVATADENPVLLGTIALHSPLRGVQLLEQVPPPEGVVIPPTTVARLLECDDAEARLRAIGLLSRTGARRQGMRA